MKALSINLLRIKSLLINSLPTKPSKISELPKLTECIYHTLKHLSKNYAMALMFLVATTPSFAGVVGITSIENIIIANDGNITVEVDDEFTECAGQGNTISFVYNEATNSVNYLTALSTAYHSGMQVLIEYNYDNSVCSMQSVAVFPM